MLCLESFFKKPAFGAPCGRAACQDAPFEQREGRLGVTLASLSISLAFSPTTASCPFLAVPSSSAATPVSDFSRRWRRTR